MNSRGLKWDFAKAGNERLVPGIHHAITDIPAAAKAGDTVVLLYIAEGQKATLLEEPKLGPGTRIHFKVKIEDDNGHRGQSNS